MNLRSPASSTAEDVEEIEANAFASTLLMPESFLLADLRDIEVDTEDPRELNALAKRYEVSTQAITFRLMNLHSLGRI
jgi:Zn-dependent peptidase ImmA (M78 family)